MIRQWGDRGSDPGQFRDPGGIAVDADENVYVADLSNNRVQVLDSDGTFLRAWGSQGSGEGEFNRPIDIAVGPDGGVYVVEEGNDRVQKFSPEGEPLAAWGSSGADDGQFNAPCALTVDAQGLVHVVDRQNRRIQVFGPDGGFVRKWSPSTEGGLWCAIAVDAANFTYLPSQTDTLHGYVNKFDVLGNRQALFAGPGDLSNPYEAAADLDGNIYALDGAGRILKLSPAGDHLLTIGSPGSGPGELRSPQGLPIDTLRGVLYVADTSNNRVQRFSVDGRHLGGWGTQGSDNGQFDRPTDVAVTPDGDVWVADSNNHRIQKFSPNGTFLARWGTEGTGDGQLQRPEAVTVGPDGSVYVADTDNYRVQGFTASGVHLATWGSQGTGDGQFVRPQGVAVREDGFVFVADADLDSQFARVQVFDPLGRFITKWGEYGFGERHFLLGRRMSFTPQGRLLVGDLEIKQYRFERPGARIDTSPPEFTNRNRPTFALSSAQETVSFECSLVPQGSQPDFGPCSGPGNEHTPAEPLADGTYAFSVRAVDGWGDPTPDPPQRTFTVDTVAPRTRITSGPPPHTNDRSPRFRFAADEELVSFECSFDGGEWEACESPVSYQDLPDGEHSFSVRATDRAGNVEPDPPVRAFSVDTIPPRTTITFGPPAHTDDPRPRFEFEADEEDVSFKCSLTRPAEGHDLSPCSGARSHRPADPLAEGDWVFVVQAVDEAGNVEADPPSRTFTVDAQAPRTTITDGPSGWTANRRPRFEFTSDTPDADFECSLVPAGADPEFAPCSGPGPSHQPRAPLVDGDYTFSVRAVDRLGRRDPAPPSVDFSVDATAPRITITAGPEQGARVPSRDVRVEFVVSDPDAEVECSLDDSELKPCASPIELGDLDDGWHTLIIRATDPFGNARGLALPFRTTAEACERAERDLAKAKPRVAKARREVKRARKRVRSLQRRGAARAKVRRAERQLTRAQQELRGVRAALERARDERQRFC